MSMRTRAAVLVLVALVVSTLALGAGSAPVAGTAGGPTAAALSAPAASAGCAQPAVAPGTESLTLVSGGVERSFIRSVPTAHDGTSPVPLVVAIHGLSEGAVLHQQTTEFAGPSEEHGFVTVYPQALGSPASWNTALGSADVAFIGDLLDHLEATLCLDTARIFVSGYSLGAFLASSVACVHAERVAAVAVVAGLRNPTGCSPSRPVPILTFHGTADTWVSFTQTPGIVAAWAARNGCDTPPTEQLVGQDDVVDIHLVSYPCGADAAPVEFYRIDQGGHGWPGSEFSRAIEAAVGYTTFEISATALIWQFFSAHPLPSDEPGGRSGTFPALSYNVAGLPAALSGSEPDINTPYISPLLNDYDLVLVQESWANPDPPLPGLEVYHEVLVSQVTHPYLSTPAPAPLGSNPERPTAIVSDGLNRMSRFPFGELTRVMWPNCFGGADTSDGGAGDCLSEKGFSVATHELASGVEVDVYNLHAEAGNTELDRQYRAEGFAALADVINQRSAGRAVIVGGDYNLNTDREIDGQIFADFLAATGLSDVCQVVDCGADSHRIDKFAFRSGGGVTLEALDHRFEREKFVRPTDGAPLSDHPALAVTFRWTASTTGGASVSGAVTDTGGAPIAGATVSAYLDTDGWEASGSTTTETDGAYHLDGLSPGNYRIVFQPPASSGLVTVWFDGSPTRAGATPLAVAAATHTPGIDATLAGGSSVSGTITTTTDQPVASVEVWAYRAADLWVGSAVAVTDPDGSYTIEGLHPGTYHITFRPPAGSGLVTQWFDGSPTRAGATPLAVAAATHTPGIDATLAGGSSVSGTITTTTDQPVASVEVWAYRAADLWVGSAVAVTDPDGSYTIEGLHPGTYHITFRPPAGSGLVTQWFDGSPTRAGATPLAVAAATHTPGIDATLAASGP
jgi:poly(3-hydroxybutyrate) depolymerase/protocatechuate 3,4-dioxygenase beta subunit